MKTSFVFILTCLLATSVWAAREVGNGGAGVSKDGKSLTFYSDGRALEQGIFELTEVPGKDLLIAELYGQSLSAQVLSELYTLLQPSDVRKYYSLQTQTLDPVLRKELIKTYNELTGVAKEDLVIFAVTDPVAKTTVFLPEFFTLSETEQAAILFHEALWIYDPEASYRQVLQHEKNVQAYLENKESPVAFRGFLDSLSLFMKWRARVPLAWEYDLKNGFKEWKATELFRPDFLVSMVCTNEGAWLVGRRTPSGNDLVSHWMGLSLKNPRSVFLKEALSNLLKEEFIPSIYRDQLQSKCSDRQEFYKFLDGLYLKRIIPGEEGVFQLGIYDQQGRFWGYIFI